MWLGIYVVHSGDEDFWCNIGDSGGVFKWPTKVVDIFGVIFVNLVGYLRGQLKW